MRNVSMAIVNNQGQLKDLENYPEGTRTWTSYGKMFVLEPMKKVTDLIKDETKTLDEQMKKLKMQQERYAKLGKENQEQLDEFIKSHLAKDEDKDDNKEAS